MTTLVQLKSQHPEWCFSCGKWWLEPGGVHTCHEHPVVAALKASITSLEAKNAELRKPETNPEWVILAEDHKRLEAQLAAREAKIAELKADLQHARHGLPGCMMPDGADPCDAFQLLTAERQSHEATKKALAERDARIAELKKETETKTCAMLVRYMRRTNMDLLDCGVCDLLNILMDEQARVAFKGADHE